MKRTGTTILTLALATILVSSLSSSVIWAHGPSDHASDRGRDRARFEKVHDVVVVECFLLGAGVASEFSAFIGPATIMLPADTSCTANLAYLLGKKFDIEHVWTFSSFGVIFERHTLSRTRIERREKGEKD